MFFYVVSRTYAEIFSLLRICSGLLFNSPGLVVAPALQHEYKNVSINNIKYEVIIK